MCHLCLSFPLWKMGQHLPFLTHGVKAKGKQVSCAEAVNGPFSPRASVYPPHAKGHHGPFFLGSGTSLCFTDWEGRPGQNEMYDLTPHGLLSGWGCWAVPASRREPPDFRGSGAQGRWQGPPAPTPELTAGAQELHVQGPLQVPSAPEVPCTHLPEDTALGPVPSPRTDCDRGLAEPPLNVPLTRKEIRK